MELRFGKKQSWGVTLIALLTVMLVYIYVVIRRQSVTVGDYTLPKKNIEVSNDDAALKQIKLEEEMLVKDIEQKMATAMVREMTVAPVLSLSEPTDNEQPRTPETKEQLRYVHTNRSKPRNNIIWVYSDGALTLKNRVNNYIRRIDSVRSELKSMRTQQNWTDVQETLKVLWCNEDDYLRSIDMYSHIKTVALSWHPWKIDSTKKWTSLGDVSNLQIQKYYEWSAEERLCQKIRTPFHTKARYDIVYRQHCNTDPQRTEKAKSIELVYFWAKSVRQDLYWPNDGNRYPSYFFDSAPMFIFHMHIVENVVITGLGDIISGDLKLVPYSCAKDLDNKPPRNYRASLLYDEVFIMSQGWGEHFFHKMLENFPRLIPYLDFLKKHQNIKIHAADSGGYTSFLIELLGLDPARLIKGVVRANFVFMPQVTYCGFPHVQATQLFSAKLREEIRKMYPVLDRNSVVLIQRSGGRRFTQAREIRRDLKELAEKFNRTFRLFADNPTPSPRESMRIFNEAVLVVGPHGAGLSNLLYSEPGTFVIEGVCNPPHINMCYQRTAHILGHHYHAVESAGGCENVVDVQSNEIMRIAEIFLSMASRKINQTLV